MKPASTITSQLMALLTILIVFGSCSQPPETAPEVVYGPIAQTYELPDVTGTIYFVAPDGDAASEGFAISAPTTIEEAFARVVSGDAIVMRGGIYRTGNLTFNQGITIQAYRDEEPVLNGTLVADSWREAGENLWVTDWDHLFPAGPEDWWNRERNEEFTPLHRFNNDAVFVDGQYLQSAGSTEEVDEETYFVDYDENRIYIGTDPADRFIEITAFRKALYRTLKPVHGKEPDDRGPVIRGVTFTQYPDTMVHIGGAGLAIDQHGRDAVGTVFENCTFSNCFRIAVFALSDSLVMRNCKVLNTNTEGVYIVASSDILLERNIIENNNIEKWTGFYPSAVKIFNQSHRAVVRENLVINHPHSNGVWWDVGNDDGVFVNNHVEGVDHNGFFFEISDGCIVAGNVFVDCSQSIFVLNASNVQVYNNTLINSRVNFSRNNRGDELGLFGWHVTTGPGVEERDGHVFVNNLLYMSGDNNSPMIQTGQPDFMCERLNEPHFKTLNNNVFVRGSGEEGSGAPIIRWSPYQGENCQINIYSPMELNDLHPHLSSGCQYLENYDGPLFRDMKNNDFRLADGFPGIGAATEIPAHIADLLELEVGEGPFLGACSP
ncbi:MAG: right-handed parallel beta-helix repeat-containing protein [Marinilabiliales bacterium]|nr:MAG: right-handed parallel beta-helix repeat-containing protein [Marinilabiliales bacterium]